MRQWQGIRRDTDSTLEDGALLLVNPDLYFAGEMSRRTGMSAFSAQTGTSVVNFWTPLSGMQAIFATSTGSVVALAAP